MKNTVTRIDNIFQTFTQLAFLHRIWLTSKVSALEHWRRSRVLCGGFEETISADNRCRAKNNIIDHLELCLLMSIKAQICEIGICNVGNIDAFSVLVILILHFDNLISQMNAHVSKIEFYATYHRLQSIFNFNFHFSNFPYNTDVPRQTAQE